MKLKARSVAILACCGGLASCANTLSAQHSGDMRLLLSRADSTVTPDPDYWKRAGTALVGELVGAVLVFGGLYALEQPCHSDMCGFGPTVAGLFIGAPLGAAVGAALPTGRGLCSAPKRFVRALAGVSVGLAPAFVGAYPAIIVTLPVGSTQFMRRC